MAATAKTVGRWQEKKEPLVAFPAHWAPDGWCSIAALKYTPRGIANGAFIAFHGS